MNRHLDYTTLPSLWRHYEDSPRQLAFRARTRKDWASWREALRGKVTELLGGFPAEGAPLASVVLARQDTPDYLMEKVAFQSEPELYVPCYVITPRRARPPYRPVIVLHGHGSGGAAHLLGRVADESRRAEEEAHIRATNGDYALQLAQHGFMVFVPEQRGFGERLDSLVAISGTEAELEQRSIKSCRAMAFNAMLLGKTAIGLRAWDAMRTVDYIRSRPEPMVDGIGCLGLSGGGTTTLFATALENRITVAVISGYINTFRASIMAMRHCECNYIPGVLKYAEMSDIAGLIAPRPLLVESGTEDHIYPVEATEAAYQELRQVYELLEVPERLAKDIFRGGHRFSGRKAFTWLDRWLPQRE